MFQLLRIIVHRNIFDMIVTQVSHLLNLQVLYLEI